MNLYEKIFALAELSCIQCYLILRSILSLWYLLASLCYPISLVCIVFPCKLHLTTYNRSHWLYKKAYFFFWTSFKVGSWGLMICFTVSLKGPGPFTFQLCHPLLVTRLCLLLHTLPLPAFKPGRRKSMDKSYASRVCWLLLN